VHYLTSRGIFVRCLVRPNSDVQSLWQAIGAARKNRVEIWIGSLGRIESWPEIAASCEVVFHLAAGATGATSVLFRDNVLGTRRLIATMRRHAIKRFVLVSSLAVYRTEHLGPGDVLDETCPLESKPHLRDPYTFSKVAQEMVAWQLHRKDGLPLTVIRPGILYGPGRDCLSTRVGFRLGRVLFMMGGEQLLPYTYVDNAAEAVALAGLAPGAEGEAFNIVDDNLPSVREFVRQYGREVRKLQVLRIFHGAIGPLSGLFEWYHCRSRGQLPPVLTRYKSRSHWNRLRYANVRTKAVLGWRPRIDFPEGLQRTFLWLRHKADEAMPAQ
jgi:nucleoside-diphosphate-sugar epimerase